MKILNVFLSLFVLMPISQNISAQSMRERIEERLANRQLADDLNLEDKKSNGKAFIPENATVQRDIAYDKDEAQRFDVYIPQNVHNAPVIFMVHGGGWRRGDKAMSRMVENKAKRWLPKGIIFVSINYRMLPKADPLVQANDVALALAKAQALASSWGGDAKRFVIMGHSAGAHLVALITASTTIARQQGVQPWLGTVLLDGAAYNVEKSMSSKHLPLYDKAFGKDENFWRGVSPSYQLTQKPLPILAVCSTTRKDQPCLQSQALVDQAKSMGGVASVLPVAMSHREINEDLGLQSAYTDGVENFLRSLGLPL